MGHGNGVNDTNAESQMFVNFVNQKCFPQSWAMILLSRNYSLHYTVCTKSIIVEPNYVSHHPTSKHHCTRLGSEPILNSQISSLLTRDESLHIIFENSKRLNVISLNQPQGMSAKMAAKIVATSMPEYVSGCYGLGFESHSHPFLLAYSEANLSL